MSLAAEEVLVQLRYSLLFILRDGPGVVGGAAAACNIAVLLTPRVTSGAADCEALHGMLQRATNFGDVGRSHRM